MKISIEFECMDELVNFSGKDLLSSNHKVILPPVMPISHLYSVARELLNSCNNVSCDNSHNTSLLEDVICSGEVPKNLSREQIESLISALQAEFTLRRKS